jgi:23S rRNA (adenine2503-C2)-methyltransferase
MKKSAYSLTSQDWLEELSTSNHSSHALSFWLDGLYKSPNIWKKHISPAFLQLMQEKFDFSLPGISHFQEAKDTTVKFLIKFSDELEVEAVLIPFHKRWTICLSTQVGCAMNCSFCFTGTQGLKRNLTSGEIVGQYLVVYKWLMAKSPGALKPSIVFMGQGEPLHNVQAVGEAIRVFHDRQQLGLGQRQMTLSTVGYLPGMDQLKDLPNINIALSLHSPFQNERFELIPLSERYPLESVVKKLDELPLLPRQFITYEYLLIKDFNMSERHVDELYRLLGKRKALVNLIPFNPFPGSKWQRPDITEIDAFKAKLVEKKLRVMIRTTKGDDILAACGQLKVKRLARISHET